MKLNITVNKEKKEFNIDPSDTLLDVLRREGYYEVKKGCNTGDCGSCTVLVDGEPNVSCIKLAGLAEGREITTVKGIGTHDNPHALQKYFVEEGGVQCGFCIPGKITSAKALLDRNPDPSIEDIKEAMDGHLCRCTGYNAQIRAIKKASREIGGDK
ncbi:MAG: (2Fe-2S)-binding protein [Candidatus Eremiobacterota bacterium]